LQVAQPIDQRDREPAAGAVAADGDVARRNAAIKQHRIGGLGVRERGWKRMFGGEPIADREGANAGGSSLRYA
jgi:hypothetical protein